MDNPKIELGFENCEDVTNLYRREERSKYVDHEGLLIDPSSTNRHGSPGATELVYKLHGRNADQILKV